MPLAASPQGLGTLPTTTMRRPRRRIASSTSIYEKAMAGRSVEQTALCEKFGGTMPGKGSDESAGTRCHSARAQHLVGCECSPHAAALCGGESDSNTHQPQDSCATSRLAQQDGDQISEPHLKQM